MELANYDPQFQRARMLQTRFLPTLPSLLSEPRTPLIHRDLSWLQFNERVLSEAQATSNPILERVKFLAITSSNLDEFFMIRFRSLLRPLSSHLKKIAQRIVETGNFDVRYWIGMRSSIMEAVAKFVAKQNETLEVLISELEDTAIHVVQDIERDPRLFSIAEKLFNEQIQIKLKAPQAFSFRALQGLKNLQIGVIFSTGFWYKIPRHLPPVYCHCDETKREAYIFLLDDLLATFLSRTVVATEQASRPILIRLTRNADIRVDLNGEDTESIPDLVRSKVTFREKGRPVRLQYRGKLSPVFLDRCASALKLEPSQIFPAPGTLCLHGMVALSSQLPETLRENSRLCYSKMTPQIPKSLRDQADIFEKVSESDYLLHHPYDSFDAYVQFIKAACSDPGVTTIEQTVYRVDHLSPVIEELKQAAKKKKIRIFIELRARFDELNNLRIAEDLKKEGVFVGFGLSHLKLHAKVALVTRRENNRNRFYTHLSTGNYNASTARQYTYFAILTSHREIGEDARIFFDALMKRKLPSSFKQLLLAPTQMHRRLLSYIEDEIMAARKGRKARIFAKVNALVDPHVIDTLYRASQAGVVIDLVVRGACSLIPGVSGLSENIRVFSIVDRFLEHSRIYHFANAKKIHLSSADWMPRNFFSRLEVAFPILDDRIYRYLEEILIPTYLQDTVKSRELTPQGTWKKRVSKSGKKSIRSQFIFEQLASTDYAQTVLA